MVQFAVSEQPFPMEIWESVGRVSFAFQGTRSVERFLLYFKFQKKVFYF